MPFVTRDALRANGWEVFVIGLRGFYDPALKPDLVIRLGGGGTAARECKNVVLQNFVLLAQSDTQTFQTIRPDLWSISVLARVLKIKRS